MKDWDIKFPPSLPVGSGKRGGKVLGDKALFALGGSEGFKTRIINLPSGDRLRVRTRDGNPEYTLIQAKVMTDNAARLAAKLFVTATLTATLRSMYMTSGAYAFGALGGINTTDPLLTIEPVTYKSGAVTGGEVPLAAIYERPPPNNGDVSKLYNQTRTPGGLNGPKQAMYDSRPSEFSGLMRRCMQARYGSGNTSQDMVRDEDSSLGSVTVGHTFGRTTAILKFGLKYFFVAISSGGGGMYGRWWPLLFPPEYEAMLLQGTDAWETLALSHAYVLPYMEGDLGNFDIAYGSPIYYGWSFSLTTNKAVCCINDYLGYAYDRRMYYLMSLTFSYDLFTNEMVCNYNLDETVDGWITPKQAPIWSPAGGETIWYNARNLSPAPTSDQDFPVHAFYSDDLLNLVRWRYSSATAPAFDGNVWNERWRIEGWKQSFFGMGSSSASLDDHFGNTVTHGFSINGMGSSTDSSDNRFRRATLEQVEWQNPPKTPDCTVDGVGGSYGSMYYTFFFDPNGHGTNFNPYDTQGLLKDPPIPDLHPGNHYTVWHRHNAYSNGTYSYTPSPNTRNHISALVIPEKDCARAYIGERAIVAGTVIHHTYNRAGGGSGLQEHWGDFSGENGAFVQKGEWVPICNAQRAISYYGTGGGIIKDVTTTTDETINSAVYANTVDLFGKEKLAVGSTDSEIFHPNPLNPKLSQQVQVLSSSLYNEMRYNDRTLIGTAATTGGYPLDITLFVGAS